MADKKKKHVVIKKEESRPVETSDKDTKEEKDAKNEILAFKLLRELQNQSPYPQAALTKKLGISTNDLWKIAAEMGRTTGIKISVDKERGFLYLVKEGEGPSWTVPIVEARGKYLIAVMSNLRLGDAYQQLCMVKSIMVYCKKAGVDFAIFAGNLLAGKPTSARSDSIFLTDGEEQLNYAVRYFPKSEKFRTYFIAGPRDLSWQIRGLTQDFVQVFCEERDDVAYLGRRFGVLPIRDSAVEIIVSHTGDDLTPQGKTYGLQKIAAQFGGHFKQIGASEKQNDKDRILLAAGWHVAAEVPDRHGMATSISLPSLYGQSPYLFRKGIAPSVGFYLIEIELDEETTPRRLKKVLARFVPLGEFIQKDDHLIGFELLKDAERTNGKSGAILQLLLEQSPRSESDLATVLGEHKSVVTKSIVSLQKAGLNIEVQSDTKRIHLFRDLRTSFPSVPELDIASLLKHKRHYAITSDIHLVSKQQQPHLLSVVAKTAKEVQARAWLDGGDIAESPGPFGYRGHQLDTESQNADEIIAYAADCFAQAFAAGDLKDIPLVGIGGNHPGWVKTATGLDLVRAVYEKLGKTYLGPVEGFLEDEGLKFYFLHPAGGVGYTASHPLQKMSKYLLEEEAPATYTHIRLAGNMHVVCSLYYDGAYNVLLPTLKNLDDYHTGKSLAPSYGFVILETTHAEANGPPTSFGTYYIPLKHLMRKNGFLHFHEWLIEQHKDDDKQGLFTSITPRIKK